MIEKCNLCWGKVKIFNPSDIYWIWYKHHNDPKEKPWKCVSFIYKCLNCSATVWCHGDTNRPFWTLANKETKNARHMVHNLLDPLWKCKSTWNHNRWSRGKERKRLYRLLSDHMGIPPEDTHMWMFNIKQCRVAYLFFLKYKARNKIK